MSKLVVPTCPVRKALPRSVSTARPYRNFDLRDLEEAARRAESLVTLDLMLDEVEERQMSASYGSALWSRLEVTWDRIQTAIESHERELG